MSVADSGIGVDLDPCHPALLAEPEILRQNAAVRILCPLEIRILYPVEHVRFNERAAHASTVDLYLVLATFPHGFDFLTRVLVDVIERTEPAHGRQAPVDVVPCPMRRESEAHVLRVIEEVPDRVARYHDVAVYHQDVIGLFSDSLFRDPVPGGSAIVAGDVIKHHPVPAPV